MFDDATQATLPPFVEVELVYETGRPGMQPSRWRAFEIWTRNRIYSCDWTMTCIEVIDRKSGAADPRHSMIGCRLSGGQVRTEEAIEVTYPLPATGLRSGVRARGSQGFHHHLHGDPGRAPTPRAHRPASADQAHLG